MCSSCFPFALIVIILFSSCALTLITLNSVVEAQLISPPGINKVSWFWFWPGKFQLLPIDSFNGHRHDFPASFHWKWKVTHLAPLEPKWAKLRVRLVVSVLNLCRGFFLHWHLSVWNCYYHGVIFCQIGGKKSGQNRHFSSLLWFIPIYSGRVTEAVFLTLGIQFLRS